MNNKSLYPTSNSLQSVISQAKANLPITTENELKALLNVYHNTLLHNSVETIPVNVRLLQAVFFALNAANNTPLNLPVFKDSYTVAAAVGNVLKGH